MTASRAPDVYTARDIADAAGVTESHVRTLMDRGVIRTLASQTFTHDERLAGFVTAAESVRAVRALVTGSQLVRPDALGLSRTLLSERASAVRASSLPFMASSGVHGVVAALLVAISVTAGPWDEAAGPRDMDNATHLVFVATPGPGGGGGGSGFRMPTRPTPAMRAGLRRTSSPLPAQPIVPPRPLPDPLAPLLDARRLPPVMAPVIVSPADARTAAGVPAAAPADSPSPGSGSGGHAGTGQGTGVGAGSGPGIGDGTGGGTGGGPYRAGSGVAPPRLLHEVRPVYPDAARRANIEGEVLLEIVVRRDGTVGDVRVVRGLTAETNERAIQAVRQWRFSPARFKQDPVDVIVEAGVEFRLR